MYSKCNSNHEEWYWCRVKAVKYRELNVTLTMKNGIGVKLKQLNIESAQQFIE